MKHINDFLNYIKYERKLSLNTYNAYKNNLNKFYNYFNSDLLILKKNDIQDFLYSLDLKPRSKAHYLTVIASFYTFLLDEGLITFNPAEGIKQPKQPKTLPQYLNMKEINDLLEINLVKPHDYRNKAMLEVLFATGIRISELVNLKLFQIDFDECTLLIEGKGKKQRIVPIHDVAIKYLKLYISEYRKQLSKQKVSEYVFINNLGTNITRQGFFKILKNLAKRSGIKKEISPHILRHSFATHMLNNGANLRVIQTLLGHENLVTTEIYAQIQNKKLEEGYKNHPHA